MMKKYVFYSYIILLAFSFFLGSCEKVIELDLDTQEKELVIEANLDWEKGTVGNVQDIQLSYTQPYYSTATPEGALGATVTVTDDIGRIFAFSENTNGAYRCNDFIPELGRRYTLSVNYQGKDYMATDLMREVPQLTQDNVTQTNDGGFTGKEIQLQLRFDADPREQNNFVLVIKASSDGVTRLYGFDGRFFADGHFFTQIVSRSTDEDEKFKSGDTVEITLYRVSENYMNFIRVLSNNSSNNGGLFSIPNRVRGNIVYTANPYENPLGAFRVAQYSKIVYTIR